MLHRGRAIVLVALGLFLAAEAAPSVVRAETGISGDALVDCLTESERSLSVMFLVDDSGSLRTRDPGPNPSRVEALRAAVEALEVVAERRDVFVEMYRFGTQAERAFDELDVWASLDSVLRSQLDPLLGRFADWEDADDTDYALALLRAGEVMRTAPAGSCRLLAWFTDGELDFEFNNYSQELEWTREHVIESWEDARAAALWAEAAICAPGGLIDGLRGDITEDGAFIAAVALGPAADFDLLERIVEDRQANCGSLPANGSVSTTFEVGDLTTLLVKAVDPPPPNATSDGITALDEDACAASISPNAPGSFSIPTSLESIRMRFESADPRVRAVLVGPEPIDGSNVIDLGATAERTSDSGVQVLTNVYSDRLAGLRLRFPDRPGSWADTWEIRFCTSAPDLVGSPGMVEVFDVTGEVRADLVDGVVLRRGRSSAASIQIVSTGSHPLTSDAIGSGSPDVSAAEVLLEVGEVLPDGSLRLSINVPEEFEPSEVGIDVALAPSVEVFPPGREWRLTPWEGRVGSLEVRDLPVYPLVDLPSSFGVLNQENRRAESTVPVSADGPESGGCVELESVSFVSAPEGTDTLSVRVFSGEQELSEGEPCVVALEAGESSEFTMEVEATPDQARVGGRHAGEITFRSTSTVDPQQSERFTYPLDVQVRPLLVVEEPEARLVALFFALAVILPLLLLYIYNYFFGARLDVVSSPLVAIPVQHDGVKLSRADHGLGAAAATRTLTVRPDDIQPWSQAPGRRRSVSARSAGGDVAEMTAHISPLPWGAPTASTIVAGHRIQVAHQGRRRSAKRGRIGLSTSKIWLFGGSPVSPGLPGLGASTGGEGESPNSIHWNGVVMIFPGVGGDLVERSNQILADANEAISMALESDDAQRIVDEERPPPSTPAEPESFDGRQSDGRPDGSSDRSTGSANLPDARPSRTSGDFPPSSRPARPGGSTQLPGRGGSAGSGDDGLPR